MEPNEELKGGVPLKSTELAKTEMRARRLADSLPLLVR